MKGVTAIPSLAVLDISTVFLNFGWMFRELKGEVAAASAIYKFFHV